jgi:hypothetical protein
LNSFVEEAALERDLSIEYFALKLVEKIFAFWHVVVQVEDFVQTTMKYSSESPR